MDGAGRLARSLRSLRPQADLKAAAIGAAMLLRERLGFGRASAKSLLAKSSLTKSSLTKPSLATIKDLTFREGLIMVPLVALTLLFGFYPKPVLDMSATSVQQLVNNYNTAVTAVKAAALLQ